MNELALFAGAGGGILGGYLLGWRTVCAVEIEDYPRRVLLQRQADGILPRFPIWDDVTTFDGHQWRGLVDVISGGFPCQDVSAAGKGAGITGAKSGLWKEMARIVGEVQPRYVFVENSPMLTSRGLGTVLGDLSEMGYDAEWGIVGAHHAGAPHKRDRIWILGYAGSQRLEGLSGDEPDRDKPGRIDSEADRSISPASIRWWDEDPADIPDADGDDQGGTQRDSERVDRYREEEANFVERREFRGNSGDSRRLWPVESKLDRVAHGLANRVDRVKAIGNGQVPAVAALAWQTLFDRLNINRFKTMK